MLNGDARICGNAIFVGFVGCEVWVAVSIVLLDISIPLPNGTLDSRLEILNGLEKNYVPYIRPTNFGQEFIKLDEEFLILFITTLMDDKIYYPNSDNKKNSSENLKI